MGQGFPVESDFQDSAPAEVADMSKSVVCGSHHAASCSQCPQGHGASWCNADCKWVFGKCISRVVRQNHEAPAVKCCSGIREHLSMYCFDKMENSGPITYQCDVT